MVITEEFKAIIDEDIDKCDYEIKNGNKQSRDVLHNTLISKYGKIIDGFKNDLRRLYYDDSGAYRTQNLETMRQKLILFKAMGYENQFEEKAADNGVTINNTNRMDVNVNITFSEARAKVEDMTSLKEEEIQEILQKIDELEQLVNSKDRKTKKWDKAKEIIKWIAEKGIDVGLTLLPLLLKLGE